MLETKVGTNLANVRARLKVKRKAVACFDVVRVSFSAGFSEQPLRSPTDSTELSNHDSGDCAFEHLRSCQADRQVVRMRGGDGIFKSFPWCVKGCSCWIFTVRAI